MNFKSRLKESFEEPVESNWKDLHAEAHRVALSGSPIWVKNTSGEVHFISCPRCGPSRLVGAPYYQPAIAKKPPQ